MSCGHAPVHCCGGFGGTKPTFHLRFDGKLDAEAEEEPGKTSEVIFVSGVCGQAAHLPAAAWFEYAYDPRYLNDRAGSFPVPYKTDKSGLFRLAVNEGQVDYRWFELLSLEQPRTMSLATSSALAQPKKTLIRTYDCTRDYPSNVFNHCGSHLVTNACGIYREYETFNSGTGLFVFLCFQCASRPQGCLGA